MEIEDTEIIIPRETAAMMWMDRFIKEYKYGTDNSVIVDGKKITWTGDFKLHSIDLKNGRFIIDGDEVFINAELWNRYLKMREITGSIFIFPPRKIAFPDDWSDLSEEQVLENIQYLQKNYKKYNISQPDDKHIKIDNVIICRDNENEISNSRICFTINNKKYYRNENNGKELIDLIHLCKMQMRPLKEKILDLYKRDKSVFFEGGSLLVLFMFACFLANYVNKNRKELGRVDTKVVKQLDMPKQVNIINYTDSIRQNHR